MFSLKCRLARMCLNIINRKGKSLLYCKMVSEGKLQSLLFKLFVIKSHEKIKCNMFLLQKQVLYSFGFMLSMFISSVLIVICYNGTSFDCKNWTWVTMHHISCSTCKKIPTTRNQSSWGANGSVLHENLPNSLFGHLERASLHLPGGV